MNRPPSSAIRMRLCAPALLVVAALPSCGSVPDRTPVPPELVGAVDYRGIPGVWFWGDEEPEAFRAAMSAALDELRTRDGLFGVEHNYLAISGGGENGAYGAGLLCGWTAAGTRPEFTIVTGISTGALSAPFAYLGSEYDHLLEEIYTTYRTEDLLEERGTLELIGGDAFASTAPLRRLIEKYMNAEVLDAIAAEYRRGRTLLIGTTDLDSSRPVIWSIGRIAISDSPDRVRLFQDILLASASIPVAFPPVYIPAQGPDGASYEVMHVDGGATSQVFLYPLGIDWREALEKLQVVGRPTAYVIRNSKISTPYDPVDPGNLANTAGRSISSLIRTQGIGDMFRLYLGAQRDGLNFRLSSIPEDFEAPLNELFDPVYMGKLFQTGYDRAQSGYPWATHPPGYDPERK